VSKGIIAEQQPEINIEIKFDGDTNNRARSFDRTADGLKKFRAETAAENFGDDIFNSIADALIVIDADMTISRVNQAALELTGFGEEELNGQPIEFLSKNRRFFAELIDGRLDEKTFARELETECLRKDGSSFPVSLSVSKIYDRQSDSCKIVCIGQDIRPLA